MRAVRTHDRDAPEDGLVVEEAPYPYAGEGDVVVKVRAACFTPDELTWPASWVDRAGRPRSPSYRATRCRGRSRRWRSAPPD